VKNIWRRPPLQHQYKNFNPNCIWRGMLTVDLIVPKSGLPRLEFGKPYDG
jgi:hypothetical protein